MDGLGERLFTHKKYRCKQIFELGTYTMDPIDSFELADGEQIIHPSLLDNTLMTTNDY